MSPDLTFATNLLVAMVLGSVIGLERQWRQRVAGLRTNALVCTGACMFATLARFITPNDLRVVGQVVTGIGFLGAGVIMREGSSIRGLNTSATLWCTAAVGAVAGTGYPAWAAIGAAAVLGLNTLLRPLSNRLSGGHADSESEFAYRIRIICEDEKEETQVRHLILQAIGTSQLVLRGLESSRLTERPGFEIRAEIVSERKDDALIEQIVNRLSYERNVESVSWRMLPVAQD